MALVFKHEALLTFVGSLIRDREFSEWFVSQPTEALASHGLSDRDVQDMADVLTNDRHQPQLARALVPTVSLLLEVIDREASATSSDVTMWVDRLNAELQSTSNRLAIARTEARPWWKFWLW